MKLLNSVLKETDNSPSEYELAISLSNGGDDDLFSRLFVKRELVGLLQANSYESLDQESPFLGAIKNACCAND